VLDPVMPAKFADELSRFIFFVDCKVNWCALYTESEEHMMNEDQRQRVMAVLCFASRARHTAGAVLGTGFRSLKAMTVLCVTALIWACVSANGQSVSYTASGAGGRSASALFQIVGGDLQVTLTSLGTQPGTQPASWNGTYALSALFFNTTLSLNTDPSAPIAGDSGAVGPGGGVLGTIPAGNTIGSFWAYGTGLSAPGGATQGLLGVGFGVGGPSAGNLGPPPPEPVDGLAGSILGWNNTTGADASVTGHEPVVYDSIVFKLTGTGLPGSLTAADFSDVSFQYGTTIDSSSGTTLPGIVSAVPEPTAVMVGALLVPLFGARALRTQRKNRAV
jgi:hypothetical protein